MIEDLGVLHMNEKMKIKTIAAIIIIAIVIPPLMFGGWLLKILEALIALAAGYEACKLNTGKADYLGTVLCFVAEMAMMYFPLSHFSVVLAIWLVVLFIVLLVKGKVETDRVVYPFTISVLIGLALCCVDAIYAMDISGGLIMLYVCLACFMCDTGAYFFGVAFGKHKMIPAISPNKTWEGSIGGYVTGLVVSLVYGLLVLKQLPTGLIIVSSIVLPLVAQVGDLSFSAIKRRFQIKDFSNLIPGHGGILDRIDSLVFCLMIFNSLMIVFGVIA